MATTYTRQKDGKMKVTKRTGYDAVSFKFGNAVQKVKSVAKKATTAIAKSSKNYDREQARKEIRDVERAFGTVEKYVEFNPDFRKRADSLYQRSK